MERGSSSCHPEPAKDPNVSARNIGSFVVPPQDDNPLSCALTASTTLECSGKPPSRYIECTRLPPTATSNEPSYHGTSSIAVSLWAKVFINVSVNARVCGSYPHSAQYVIVTLTVDASDISRPLQTGCLLVARSATPRSSRTTSALANGLVSLRMAPVFCWTTVRTSSGNSAMGLLGSPQSGFCL